ncbi:MAG: glycosyltransferase family 1 protein [Limnothrix sp. CACIAM 69d]|nr:MAG: glycosyltransferase family 1 protein [Limnothrix sp. CACIAM 69d]
MQHVPSKPISAKPRSRSARGSQWDAFVFLEVFDNEGGIQTYNQNLLTAYACVAEPNRQGRVWILRDRPMAKPPIGEGRLEFNCFGGAKSRAIGRLQMLASLAWNLWIAPPRQVFCGHINLVQAIAWICQVRRIPYTVLTHGKEVWDPLSPPARRALQRADALWIVSRYSRDRASQANQLNPDRVDLMPCPVDGTVFRPGPKPPELLAQYGLADCKVLMTVARLWPGDRYKGVDVTIRALPLIARAVPNVKYLVIGRGEDRPRLEALACEMGVGDRVVFAGFVATEALPDFYRAADLYVMPSQEGFGIAYLEAMATGVPVISGDDDGSADPLQDGRLGWRVPHRDSEAVARAAIAALTTRGDRRCDGAWLRQEALGLFGVDAFRDRLHQLLNRSPQRGPRKP